MLRKNLFLTVRKNPFFLRCEKILFLKVRKKPSFQKIFFFKRVHKYMFFKSMQKKFPFLKSVQFEFSPFQFHWRNVQKIYEKKLRDCTLNQWNSLARCGPSPNHNKPTRPGHPPENRSRKATLQWEDARNGSAFTGGHVLSPLPDLFTNGTHFNPMWTSRSNVRDQACDDPPRRRESN